MDFFLSANLFILYSHLPLFLNRKTITKLNLGQGERYEANFKKIVVIYVL